MQAATRRLVRVCVKAARRSRRMGPASVADMNPAGVHYEACGAGGVEGELAVAYASCTGDAVSLVPRGRRAVGASRSPGSGYSSPPRLMVLTHHLLGHFARRSRIRVRSMDAALLVVRGHVILLSSSPLPHISSYPLTDMCSSIESHARIPVPLRINSRWFLRTSVILFLNKIDVFKRKLPKIGLGFRLALQPVAARKTSPVTSSVQAEVLALRNHKPAVDADNRARYTDGHRRRSAVPHPHERSSLPDVPASTRPLRASVKSSTSAHFARCVLLQNEQRLDGIARPVVCEGVLAAAMTTEGGREKGQGSARPHVSRFRTALALAMHERQACRLRKDVRVVQVERLLPALFEGVDHALALLLVHRELEQPSEDLAAGGASPTRV
ncbi:hypothetical protein B0H16DRAFT_1716011 [Mycena metata]|uniref:Uncharacterized protein n=1 Tax=Mycena metata TaxID=1033252 RepID=A0AAD7NNE6_9AGAR|nr:hypothetical protein B0H16DRAFT_1716011 [Mycena metata]